MTTQPQQDCQTAYKIASKWRDLNLFIYLTGEFGLKNLTVFTGDIKREISSQKAQAVTIDFSQVCYLDSAAALAFVQIEKESATQNIPCRLVNLNDESKGIFSVIHEDALTHPSFKSEISDDGLIRQVGQASLDIARDFVNSVTFIGELLVALLYTLRHPKSLRGKDVLFYVQRAGVDGLPIVALIGLLIGLIIAFMSFLQLKQARRKYLRSRAGQLRHDQRTGTDYDGHFGRGTFRFCICRGDRHDGCQRRGGCVAYNGL